MNKYEKAYAKSYHRHGKYSIEYVKNLWESSKTVYESTGEWPIIDVGNGICVTMDSDRYSNFFINGTDCVSCGLKGEYFWLETFNVKKSKNGAYYKNKWHFNLYGILQRFSMAALALTWTIIRSFTICTMNLV